MGRTMRRGEIWLAEVGKKRRPVVVLTRTEVIDVRALVTVGEITTSIRGLSTEVSFDYLNAGLTAESVVNCDGIHTVPQSILTSKIGEIEPVALTEICSAVGRSIGC